MFYYLNEDKTCTRCDLKTWSNQFEELRKHHKHHVSEDEIDGFLISTVFLGNNHNFFGGPPLLFETMVFKGDSGHDIYMNRYTTWAEAEEGHKKAIQWVKNGCKEDD